MPQDIGDSSSDVGGDTSLARPACCRPTRSETGLTADGPTVPMVLVSPRKVHADQADIDTPLVRELVAAQFPQWAALPLEPVDSGGLVNAIYRLGTDLSVRLPLRPSITDIVQREQAKLAALAPFLPVAIPSVEAIGSPTDAFPGAWSVHRWLTGTHPSPDALADPHAAGDGPRDFRRRLPADRPAGPAAEGIRASAVHVLRWSRWTPRRGRRSAS